MSSDAVRQILEERLATEWGVRTPIAWDNTDYTPEEGTPFIKCMIEGTTSEPKTGKCQREFYQMEIQILTPKGSGTGENMTMGDDLVAMFFGFAESTLICKKAHVERQGDMEEWHSRAVFVDVQYDQNFA